MNVLNKSLVLDEARTIAVPDMSDSQDALIVDPLALLYLQHETMPIFVSEWRMTKEGPKQRAPASDESIATFLRNDYFKPSELDEKEPARILRNALTVALKYDETTVVQFTTYLPLRALVACFFFLDMEREGKQLFWSFGSLSEAVQP